MVPPLKPSVKFDVTLDRHMENPNQKLMHSGTYWFAMTQRQQQTGWATPREVAQSHPYNPYSDPYHLAARVHPDPITFVGLPPEKFKESFLSDVIEIRANDAWNIAKVKVGKDYQPRPDYFMTTPAGQNAESFPIAPQIYHAFYVSSDSGMTWKLYSTHRSSLAAPYSFTSNFGANDYANRNTLNQAMGNFPDDVTITATKIFAKPAPPKLSGARMVVPKPDYTMTYALLGIVALLGVWILYFLKKS